MDTLVALAPNWLEILFLICALICHADNLKPGSVQLKEIGFQGSWDEFCDYNKIDKDFSGFIDHDIKRIRITLCHLRNRNQIIQESLPAFAAYKYCEMIRPNIEHFYFRLNEKFSQHNATTMKNVSSDEKCFDESIDVFHKICMGKESPCIRMFRTVLRAACTERQIPSQDINQYLKEVCSGKYVTDQIDWKSIVDTINFKIDTSP